MRSTAELAISAAVVALAGTIFAGTADARGFGSHTERVEPTSFVLEICPDHVSGTELGRLWYTVDGVEQQSPYQGVLDETTFVPNGERACTHIPFEADSRYPIEVAVLSYRGARTDTMSVKLTKIVEADSNPLGLLGSLGGDVTRTEVTVYERTQVGGQGYQPGPFIGFIIDNPAAA